MRNALRKSAVAVYVTLTALLVGYVGLAGATPPPPEDSVDSAVDTLGTLFAANWSKFALFALSFIAVSIAVSLFKMALNKGRRAATGKAGGV